MNAIRALFSLSKAPIDDHPDFILDQKSPLLGYAIWVILAGAAVYMALLIAAARPEYLGRIHGTVAIVVLAVIAQLVLRYRGTVATIRLLSIGGWLAATYAAFVGDGVRAPILVAYPTILIFSGWMLGARYSVALFFASMAAVLLMVIGERAGAVANAGAVPPGVVAVAVVAVLAISTVMTLYLLKLFRQRYAEERRLNSEIRLHLESLEKREGYQRALLDNFPFMVWLKDDQGRYLAVNQAFVSGFGWPSAAAVVGKTDLDIAATQRAERARDEEITVFGSGSAQPVEQLIEMRGKWRWCETCKSPVTVDGQVVGMVGYARDITERRAVDEAIAESRNLLRTVIDTAPVRVSWKGRDLRYLGCNAAFARDAGLAQPQDVVGKDDYQMSWAAQADSWRAADRAVLESGVAQLDVEEAQAGPRGEARWLRRSRVPLRDQDSQIIGVLGIDEDITELKETATELERHRNRR
jgi:PAS domain S-box-containing protein